MESETRPKLRWYQFTIRRLLLLVIVLGAIFAWAGKIIVRATEQRRIVAQLVADGATVQYGSERIGSAQLSFRKQIERAIFGRDAVDDVESIDFGVAPGDRDLAALSKLLKLKVIGFDGSGVTDHDLSYIAEVNELRELNLVDTSVTPAGLSQLSDSSGLETLFLSGASITDQHVKAVGTLHSLRYFRLSKTTIGNIGMEYLGSMSELRGLDLYQDGSIGSSGFEQVSKLPRLEQLWIIDTVKQDDDLRSIGSLADLKVLRLWTKQVDDGIIDYIVGLRRLTFLDLREVRLSDSGIARLVSLPALETLLLDDTPVGDGATNSLRSMGHLQQLDINGTKVSDVGLAQLQGLQSLTELRVSVGKGITMQGVQRFKNARPSCNIIVE